MSDITGPSPAPPSQPSGGQGAGPDRVADARFNKEQRTADEGGGKGEQQRPEREVPTARFDPAVAVAPSLLHLAPGDEIKGAIARVDAEQRPILETHAASYALEPDAGLKARDTVLIRIEEVDRKTIGTLVEKNSAPVEARVEVTLTLVSLHETPDARPVVETSAGHEPVQPAYHPESATPTPDREPDLQSSLLALSGSGALGPPADITKPAIQTQQTQIQTPSSGLVSVLAAGANPVAPAESGAIATSAAPPASLSSVTPPSPATVVGTPGAAGAAGAVVSGNIPKPGQVLAGRLIAADPSAIGSAALGQITRLSPGTALTLTVLGAGETAGNSSHQGVILQGTVVSADQIATTQTTAQTTAPPSTAIATAPTESKAEATPPLTPAPPGTLSTSSNSLASPTPPQGDLHYLQTAAGALIFHADGIIAPGTPLTIAVTANAPTTAAAGSTPAATTTATTAQPANVTGAAVTGVEVAGIENPEQLAKSIVDSVRQGIAASSTTDPGTGANAPTATAAGTGTTSDPAQVLSGSGSGARPAVEAPLAPLPPLAAYNTAWPVIDEVMAAVAQADPTAQGIASARMPAPNQRFPNTFLFFLTAMGMRRPTAWFGDRANKAVETLRGLGLLKRFQAEFARLGRVTRDAPGTEWRPFIVPMQHDGGTHAMVVLTRPHAEERQHREKGGGNDESDESGDEAKGKERFLVEFNLSRLGRVQLDGLMQPDRLDLVVRAGNALSASMQDDLRVLYNRAIEGEGLSGFLGFEPLSRSPVDVQDILARAIPEDHKPFDA